MNPIAAGSEDKRLENDLEGFREDLWEYANADLKDDITDQQFKKATLDRYIHYDCRPAYKVWWPVVRKSSS